MANTMILGTNNSQPQYWSQQQAFKDLRKNAGFSITSHDGGAYDTKGHFIPGDYKTDASGNPTNYLFSAVGAAMPTGTFARTLMVRDLIGPPDGDPYPSGTYHILYEGSGILKVSFDASIPGVGTDWVPAIGPSGDVSFTVAAPSIGGILLDTSSAGPTGYLKNIRVVHDDNLSSYETEPFDPNMIQDLKEVTDTALNGGYLRLMNWTNTNGEEGPVPSQPWRPPARPIDVAWRVAASSWDDRSKPYSPAGGGLGGSLEDGVDICNTIDRNMWYCIPHRATSASISSAATYIRDNLNDHLTVAVEWANEFWNRQFFSNYYCWSGAADPSVSADYFGGITVNGNQAYPAQMTFADWAPGGPSGTEQHADRIALRRYGADRSKEVNIIFSSVFSAIPGSRPGLKRVLAGHAANAFFTEQMLLWSGVGDSGAPSGFLDAISTAPYFGSDIGNATRASSIVIPHPDFSATTPPSTLASGPWKYLSSVGDILASVTLQLSSYDQPTSWNRQHVRDTYAIVSSYGYDYWLYECGQHLIGVGSYQRAMYGISVSCNADPGMNTLYNIYLNMLQEEGVDLACMYKSTSRSNLPTSFGHQQYYGQEIRPKYDAIVAWLYTQTATFLNNVKYRLNINS